MSITVNSFNIKGQARIKLIDQRVIDEASKMHPTWKYEDIREAIITRGDYSLDSGWQSNTITDQTRRMIAGGTAFGSLIKVFIHQGTVPSNVARTSLQHVYDSQTPSQVKAPDTTTLDASTLVQTRTVQFSAPTVARDINIVGLTTLSSYNANEYAIHGICAYTLLSSTIIQGTSQAADVQYRVTFTLDL